MTNYRLIPDFNRHYASAKGKIYRKEGEDFVELEKFWCADGYKLVTIKGLDYRIDQLVALTWVKKRQGEERMENVEHIDGLATNDNVDNLRWTDGSDLKTIEFISQAQGIHGNKYSYEKSKYTRITKKLIICCPKHGDFEQTPASHIGGVGCKKCGHKLGRLNTATFIERAKLLYGDRFRYSKTEYTNGSSKITIICRKHGEFLQRAGSHLRGQICCKCAHDEGKTGKADFIKRAEEVHGHGKYGYAKVIYKNAVTKVTIRCKIHGDFEQIPNSHLQGIGCRKCADDIRRLDTKEFIRKAKIKHENKYDYSESEYYNTRTKVTVICPTHGAWKIRAHNHLNGQGCPTCGGSTSKVSLEWLDLIAENKGINIRHAHNGGEKRIGRYCCDGYAKINGEKVVFEFDGCYWHGCTKCFEDDTVNKYGATNGKPKEENR